MHPVKRTEADQHTPGSADYVTRMQGNGEGKRRATTFRFQKSPGLDRSVKTQMTGESTSPNRSCHSSMDALRDGDNETLRSGQPGRRGMIAASELGLPKPVYQCHGGRGGSGERTNLRPGSAFLRSLRPATVVSVSANRRILSSFSLFSC